MAVIISGKRRWLAATVVAVVGLGLGAWWWTTRQNEAPVYSEVKVTRGDLASTVLATGIVQPRNRLEIKPPIPGRVETVLVEEGQNVQKGTVLAWMSSTERAALLDAARARGPEEVKRWEEMYRATPILAPITGSVILRKVEPGQSFTSSDAVFVMSDRLIVIAQVDETDIAQVRLRQSARVELDAYPGQGFAGQVGQIAFDSKTVSNVTTYEVDVLPQKIPSFMRSGMTANVTFTVATRKDVVRVPAGAVQWRNDQAIVLRPAANPRQPPVEHKIRTGMNDGRQIEVLEGLGEGDVVLVAQTRLRSRETIGSNPFMPQRRR
jgi:macrolide-specific efflux system membrane fusion protein